MKFQVHKALTPLFKDTWDSLLEICDFMRGGEIYKYRFGAVDRHIVKITINR